MSDRKSRDRGNQQYRTRKDLLAAAARLMKEGRKPSLEEVAEAALVSRATAYRYFPNLEVLLAEASIDIATPDGPTLFAHDTSSDAEARVERAEAVLHRAVYDNEPALRVMLASSVMVETQGLPVRQNRRLPLIEAALAPVRNKLDSREYERLCRALCLIFGPEAMIVFKDVLRIDEQATRDVKAWAIRAFVRAALDSHAKPRGVPKTSAAPTA
jgi:AcrR family transcriptional regulator